jgi:hypothetical protein
MKLPVQAAAVVCDTALRFAGPGPGFWEGLLPSLPDCLGGAPAVACLPGYVACPALGPTRWCCPPGDSCGTSCPTCNLGFVREGLTTR